MGRARINITYTARGPSGKVYIGRASCYCSSPETALDYRWRNHHMAKEGYGNAEVDVWITGDWYSPNWGAIRGREQQMIDAYGGVGSPFVANINRGVSKDNPFGRTYHNLSDARFGNVAPYTGN